MRDQSTYLSNLTPLRGIAALITVLYHVDVFFAGGGMLLPFAPGISYRLYLMVDLFFVLSGFIMLHVYGPWFAQKISWDAFRKFVRARFARIYPLHFLMLLTMIGALTLSSGLGQPEEPALEIENNWFSVITNLLLLHAMNIHNWFTWVHASWSISTEWWMYMIFPFLVVPVSRINSLGRLTITIMAFGGYWLITLVLIPLTTIPPQLEYMRIPNDLHTINAGFQFGFIRCAIGFILGMVMYRMFTEGAWKNLLGNGYTLSLLTVLLFTAFYFSIPDAFTVMLFPLILLSAAYGSSGINRLFSGKILQKLGDWSYSIYLTHQPLLVLIIIVIQYIEPPVPGETFMKPPTAVGWVLALITVSLTLSISALIYRYWEKPLRKWINPDFS